MLCTIEADLSQAPILTQPNATGEGRHYIINIDVILLFGMTELQAQLAWMENVSRLHMLFNPTDFGLMLRVFLGSRETVSFNREIVSLLNCPNSSYLYIFTGVQLRLFEPDTTNDGPWELLLWNYYRFILYICFLSIIYFEPLTTPASDHEPAVAYVHILHLNGEYSSTWAYSLTSGLSFWVRTREWEKFTIRCVQKKINLSESTWYNMIGIQYLNENGLCTSKGQ